MQPAELIARFAFAAADADAGIRWSLRQAPVFDARLRVGPFTTLVGFLPPAFAATLAESVAALPALAEHFRYPLAQLHVTVRNLDGVDLAGLPALLEGLQPIPFRADGFRFSRETLLLRVLPADPTLRCIRRRLDELPGMRRGWLPRRDLAFANVLRLNGPVAAELRRTVSQQRRALAGRRFDLDELFLIRTDKVGSPARTDVLDRYSLRRSADSP